jgi:hypothetical protein
MTLGILCTNHVSCVTCAQPSAASKSTVVNVVPLACLMYALAVPLLLSSPSSSPYYFMCLQEIAEFVMLTDRCSRDSRGCSGLVPLDPRPPQSKFGPPTRPLHMATKKDRNSGDI